MIFAIMYQKKATMKILSGFIKKYLKINYEGFLSY